MSASTVYLIRSLGTVWGVAVTAAIVQTTLSMRLPEALGDIPDKGKVRCIIPRLCVEGDAKCCTGPGHRRYPALAVRIEAP